MATDSPHNQPPPLPVDPHDAARAPADALHDRARPSTAEQAARASWLAAAVAGVLLVLTWKMPRGAGSVVIAIINSALLLAGLCLGMVALGTAQRNGAGSKSVNVQAGIGVGISALLLVIIVTSTFFFGSSHQTTATTSPATSATPGAAGAPPGTVAPDPLFDFPGWVGVAIESRAAFILYSVPNDLPSTRELTSKFPKVFEVLMLQVSTSEAPYDVWVDTSRATAHFSDGQTVAAPSIRDLLESATADKAQLINEWMPPRQCRARAGAVTNMFIPMPAGTYFKNMDRVSVTVNGLLLDIRGAYLTPEEKRQRLSRTGQAQQQQSPPGSPH